MFCSVLLLSPPYTLLTYALPQDLPSSMWNLGARVVVPLGSSWRVGVIRDFVHDIQEDFKVKTLGWPVDQKPFFTFAYLEFVDDLSIRQMDAPGRIIARVVPQAMRSLPVFKTNEGQVLTLPQLVCPELMETDLVTPELAKPELTESELTESELAGPGLVAPDTIAQAWTDPRTGEENSLSPAQIKQRQTYAALWLAGKITPVSGPQSRDRFFSLATEPPWPVRANAHVQQAVLIYLDRQGPSSMASMAKSLGSGARAALQTLKDKGLVQEVESLLTIPVVDVPRTKVELSTDQGQVVNKFAALLAVNKPQTGLLFGITSSGKTAVYLELAKRCLAQGRHVFLLAPEVAIALKLYADACAGLQEIPIYLYHGYLTSTQRQRIFTTLASADQPVLIVGTRSSLFLPLDPGLIILDEEHDASFKQDEGLIYQSREVAYGRILHSQGLLLMGSATPDIKVFYAAQKGDIHLAFLEQRVGGGTLPQISLVDLETNPQEYGPFAASVAQALLKTIAAGEQAIILHNRRGYAPVLYCQPCAAPLACPFCQISLTLHKGRSLLLCHYCGYSVDYPSPCPTCQGQDLFPLGSGTERLEEFLSTELPQDTGVLRLDRDISRRAGAMQEVLDSFAQGQAQVLVGTQMLSKGHHFPGVTLVIVVDGDLGLNLPDYRATERCFQMLVQVSGRAGRGDKPGQVMIQTRNPGHYCWQFIQKADYEGFYAQEIALREQMNYPPFVKLALLGFSWPVNLAHEQELKTITAQIKILAEEAGVQVLGPAPAPFFILRGRRRFQCLLKATHWPALRQVGLALRKFLTTYKHVRMALDLDPVDML